MEGEYPNSKNEVGEFVTRFEEVEINDLDDSYYSYEPESEVELEGSK